MSDKLDLTKPDQLQTRDGSQFRIYATDHSGMNPIVGAVKAKHGWHSQLWDVYGHVPGSNTNHPLDLVRKPARVTGWVNVYATDHVSCAVYTTKAGAESKASDICLGQIYIDSEIVQS